MAVNNKGSLELEQCHHDARRNTTPFFEIMVTVRYLHHPRCVRSTFLWVRLDHTMIWSTGKMKDNYMVVTEEICCRQDTQHGSTIGTRVISTKTMEILYWNFCILVEHHCIRLVQTIWSSHWTPPLGTGMETYYARKLSELHPIDRNFRQMYRIGSINWSLTAYYPCRSPNSTEHDPRADHWSSQLKPSVYEDIAKAVL